ncbi:MAG: cupredoxin domain-containing protein [Deltaproteobacteria bacterium]|nr:cupredoxin domain-containing protein [Deltaproteobacteria bacterium]
MKTLIRTFFSVIAFALAWFGVISYIHTYTTKAESESADKTATMKADIKLFTFKPKSLEVPGGTAVVWTNGDAVDHSVTNGTPEKLGGAFGSGFFNKGQTFSFTFTKAGEYQYFCKKHDFMRGAIKVVPAP